MLCYYCHNEPTFFQYFVKDKLVFDKSQKYFTEVPVYMDNIG